jgi:hypothetical protein
MNFRHNSHLGKLKAFSRIIKQESCSAALMRLKNTPYSPRIVLLLGRRERHPDFRRVVDIRM